MRLHALRLHEGDLLKESIERFIRNNAFSAVTVVSAVGSLNSATLRMAGATADSQDVRTLEGPFEIVSLIGNLGLERTHLHIALSDKTGSVVGGHLKEGSVVHTTVEVVLLEEAGLQFESEFDPETGFEELKIKEKKK